MDISGLSKVSTSVAETGTKRDVDVAVLKKSMDVAASTAAQLIQALPTVSPASNLPSHLGKNINTTA